MQFSQADWAQSGVLCERRPGAAAPSAPPARSATGVVSSDFEIWPGTSVSTGLNPLDSIYFFAIKLDERRNAKDICGPQWAIKNIINSLLLRLEGLGAVRTGGIIMLLTSRQIDLRLACLWGKWILRGDQFAAAAASLMDGRRSRINPDPGGPTARNLLWLLHSKTHFTFSFPCKFTHDKWYSHCKFLVLVLSNVHWQVVNPSGTFICILWLQQRQYTIRPMLPTIFQGATLTAVSIATREIATLMEWHQRLWTGSIYYGFLLLLLFFLVVNIQSFPLMLWVIVRYALSPEV